MMSVHLHLSSTPSEMVCFVVSFVPVWRLLFGETSMKDIKLPFPVPSWRRIKSASLSNLIFTRLGDAITIS